MSKNSKEKKVHQPKPSHEDWSKIHAKAWGDSDFRQLLENDPRAAIDAWGKEHNKKFDKVLYVAEQSDDGITPPPACC